MSELDEKLNQILSSPDTMEQIFSIANALSGNKAEGGSSSSSAPSPPAQSASVSPAPEAKVEGSSSSSSAPAAKAEDGKLSGLLSDLDPAMMGKLMTLYRTYQQGDGDEKTALLTSLRPFLRTERAKRIDRAIQVTRLTRVLRLAMDLFRKEDGGV